MTLKTTSAPLDRLLLTEWRTAGQTWVGVSYTNLSTAHQTEFDRYLNEAHEYLSQRAAHQPWGKREYSSDVVDAGTDTTYPMPADFRHLIAIHEETSTRKIRADVSSKEDYFDALDDDSAHPWASRSIPVYFFDGMTNGEPPVQQWRRLGLGNAGATIRVFYRPYYNILDTTGSDSYVDLPAGEVAAVRAQFQHKWAVLMRDWEGAAIYKSVREDEIAALEINDRVESEYPMRQGHDSDFTRQMG